MNKALRTCLIALTLSLPVTAIAGPYGDSLTKCLVERTTSAEKTILVQWIFVTISVHPEVASMVSTTPERRTEASKRAANMFQTLLTKTCLDETRKAVKFEGPAVLEQSFNQLGQIAARELFTHPKVAASMTEFATFVDKKAMEKAFGPEKK
jgi:hypothetical protein